MPPRPSTAVRMYGPNRGPAGSLISSEVIAVSIPGPRRRSGPPHRLVGGGRQGEFLDPFGELQCRRRPFGGVGRDGPGDDLPDVRVYTGGDGRRVRHDTTHGQERVVVG